MVCVSLFIEEKNVEENGFCCGGVGGGGGLTGYFRIVTRN